MSKSGMGQEVGSVLSTWTKSGRCVNHLSRTGWRPSWPLLQRLTKTDAGRSRPPASKVVPMFGSELLSGSGWHRRRSPQLRLPIPGTNFAISPSTFKMESRPTITPSQALKKRRRPRKRGGRKRNRGGHSAPGAPSLNAPQKSTQEAGTFKSKRTLKRLRQRQRRARKLHGEDPVRLGAGCGRPSGDDGAAPECPPGAVLVLPP